MAVEPFCHAISAGNDGLQYLCAKYSSLISRLREEVVARQKAESDAQSLQQQLQDQAEAHLAERASWEERRTALNHEIEVLSASQHGAAERRFAEAADLRHAAGANDQLSHRCDDLQRAMQDEAKKATQLTEHLAKGNEAQRRQGDELSQLRRDNVELVNQHRTVYDELISSRNQLSRARQTIVELEDQVIVWRRRGRTWKPTRNRCRRNCDRLCAPLPSRGSANVKLPTSLAAASVSCDQMKNVCQPCERRAISMLVALQV